MNKIIFILNLFLGLGVLLGLGPFSVWVLGCFAPLSLILLTRYHYTKKWMFLFPSYFCTAFFISIIAFNWVIIGLQNLTHLSLPVSLAGFLVYALLFQIKILFFLVSLKLIYHFTQKESVWVYASIGTLTDIFTYQLFPWYYGNLISGNLGLSQLASVLGVYGLSFLSFLFAWIVLEIINFIIKKYRIELPENWKQIIITKNSFGQVFQRIENLAIVAILIVLQIWGTFRSNVTPSEKLEFVNIGLIQPNTPIGLIEYKNNPEYISKAYITMARLGLKAIYDSGGILDLLIFPESSAPFYGTNPDEVNRKANYYDPNFHAIIALLSRIGRVDIAYNEMQIVNNKKQNTLTLFSYQGNRTQSYAKRRLVPMGEYLPAFIQNSFLRKLFLEVSDYAPGENPTPIQFSYHRRNAKQNLPPITEETISGLQNIDKLLSDWPEYSQTPKSSFVPLICYEGLFSEDVLDFFKGNSNADFLLNLVNDSWFGNYLENYQHSEAAKLRSIETGRFLIRATLSGVSSVTDPFGSAVVADTKIGQSDLQLISLPIYTISTFYSQNGNILLILFCLVCLVAFLSFQFIIQNKKFFISNLIAKNRNL